MSQNQQDPSTTPTRSPVKRFFNTIGKTPVKKYFAKPGPSGAIGQSAQAATQLAVPPGNYAQQETGIVRSHGASVGRPEYRGSSGRPTTNVHARAMTAQGGQARQRSRATSRERTQPGRAGYGDMLLRHQQSTHESDQPGRSDDPESTMRTSGQSGDHSVIGGGREHRGSGLHGKGHASESASYPRSDESTITAEDAQVLVTMRVRIAKAITLLKLCQEMASWTATMGQAEPLVVEEHSSLGEVMSAMDTFISEHRSNPIYQKYDQILRTQGNSDETMTHLTEVDAIEIADQIAKRQAFISNWGNTLSVEERGSPSAWFRGRLYS